MCLLQAAVVRYRGTVLYYAVLTPNTLFHTSSSNTPVDATPNTPAACDLLTDVVRYHLSTCSLPLRMLYATGSIPVWTVAAPCSRCTPQAVLGSLQSSMHYFVRAHCAGRCPLGSSPIPWIPHYGGDLTRSIARGKRSRTPPRGWDAQ